MFLLVNNDSFILAVKSVQLNKPKYKVGAMKTGAMMIIASDGSVSLVWKPVISRPEPNPSHIMLWLARSLVLDTPYFSLKHHLVANPSLISHLLGELVLFLLLSHSFRFLSQPGSPQCKCILCTQALCSTYKISCPLVCPFNFISHTYRQALVPKHLGLFYTIVK